MPLAFNSFQHFSPTNDRTTTSTLTSPRRCPSFPGPFRRSLSGSRRTSTTPDARLFARSSSPSSRTSSRIFQRLRRRPPHEFPPSLEKNSSRSYAAAAYGTTDSPSSVPTSPRKTVFAPTTRRRSKRPVVTGPSASMTKSSRPPIFATTARRNPEPISSGSLMNRVTTQNSFG